jgi:hypothetical protein
MDADSKLAWLPTKIKKLPICGLESGVEPNVVAMDCTTGKTIPPPRAVLLGTKGANINSRIFKVIDEKNMFSSQFFLYSYQIKQ